MDHRFPAFHVHRVTYCLKTLVGSHFSLAIAPDSVTIGKATKLTGKGKATSKGQFHHVFSVVEIQCA